MTVGDGLMALRRVKTTEDVAAGVRTMVTMLRQRNYSVGDLLRDIAAVKIESIGEVGVLDAVLTGCVERTAQLHELAIETMQHGFCELTADGRIGYANPALLAMLPGCEGQRLAGYFPAETALIERAVSDGSLGHTHQVELETPERSRPVMVTIGPGAGPASFAFVMDLTASVAAERRAHDTAPFAVMQLDPKHRITYVNREAGRLLGGTAEDLVGTPADHLAASQTGRSALQREFGLRKQGRTSEYRLEVQPIDGMPSEPMMIRSIPTSDPGGRLASTMVTFRRIGPEEVGTDIREAVAGATGTRALFEQVVSKLGSLVSFDLAVLWLYTDERRFSRLMYALPSLGVDALWFEVPEGFRGIADKKEPFGTIAATLSETQGGDQLSRESVVQALNDGGMRAWYAVPIGDAAQDAVLTLYAKDGRFDNGTTADITTAGVAQAMQAVLRLRAEREISFRFDLMREMAITRTDRELAALVVSELAKFYRWQNVSIFKVNVAQRQFELLEQASGPVDGFLLPDGYCQEIGTGFLGKATTEARIVVVDDAQAEPEKSMFVVGSDKTRSELIVPIRSDGQIAWVLNIEDQRRNVFREPDVTAIRELMDKIEDGLGRLLVAAVLEQVLEEVPHGVVITDLAGRIVIYNRCAREMMGDGAEDMTLDRFFPCSPEAASAALQETNLAVEGVLTGAGGRLTKVLVSARMPRTQYDRRLVFMQDAEKLARQSETREMMRTLAKVAAETRIPLSLASSYIQQIGRQAKDIVGGVAEMAGRAAAQLATVEMSYSRVVDQVHRRAQTESVALGDMLERLLQQVPEALARRVRLPVASGVVVEADRRQLLTAVRGMLAYALRTGEGEIGVNMRRFDGLVGLSMSQALPHRIAERDVAMARFALDGPGLVQFAGLLGGDFRHRRSMGRETLLLILPRPA